MQYKLYTRWRCSGKCVFTVDNDTLLIYLNAYYCNFSYRQLNADQYFNEDSMKKRYK